MKYTIFDSKITPTDVKIYIEDGIPYLDYTGTAMTNQGKVKIHIPKIGLEIDAVTKEVDECYAYNDLNCPLALIKTREQFFVSNNKLFEYEIIEREMSKEDIEKELGYKVKIMK